MPSVSEAIGGDSQMAATLAEGVALISVDQTITFTKYTRYVLPLDGFVFWIKNGVPVRAKGSLHYSTQSEQREDETISINHVIFTSKTPVKNLNDQSPDTLCIGEFQGIKFSFSRRGSFYKQADLYHYVGDAIYPAMYSQVIDSISCLECKDLIVSNSLPIWLGLNKIMPMYPSSLVPANARPPYAAVHIEPSQTIALQAAPRYGRRGTHWQLVSDKVKITMYGLGNQQALDFQDYVFQYSLDTDAIGVMNIPVIRDAKRTQAELSVLAMKKEFEIDVSYYQTRVRDIARQLIVKVVNLYFPQPL
jgi:hypothetical protein